MPFAFKKKKKKWHGMGHFGRPNPKYIIILNFLIWFEIMWTHSNGISYVTGFGHLSNTENPLKSDRSPALEMDEKINLLISKIDKNFPIAVDHPSTSPALHFNCLYNCISFDCLTLWLESPLIYVLIFSFIFSYSFYFSSALHLAVAAVVFSSKAATFKKHL